MRAPLILLTLNAMLALPGFVSAETSIQRFARKVNAVISQTQRVAPRATTKDAEVQEENKKAAVDQRLAGLQSELERAEAKLHKSMEQFAKQREAALSKNDKESLKRIEKLEATAIQRYEKRIESLVGGLEQSTGNQAIDSQKPTQPEPPSKRDEPSRSEPKKNGFRLFRLGR